MAEDGWQSAGHAELYAANAAFHEALAGLSGNRFVVQTIIRQNQLRRLVEYKEIDDRARVRRQCEEHLAIIGLLERGERTAAAVLLAEHLTNAGREKVAMLKEALDAR